MTRLLRGPAFPPPSKQAKRVSRRSVQPQRLADQNAEHVAHQPRVNVLGGSRHRTGADRRVSVGLEKHGSRLRPRLDGNIQPQ